MILGVIVSFLISWSHAVGTYELAYRRVEPTGDFEHFQNLLLNKTPTSIESLLATWKEDRPDYFSTYVMAYRSRSLQQSTPSHPRIIMYSGNADFVLTFNSDPTHRGVENIEMMRFNHGKNSFEFFELHFEEGKPVLSEPNPRKCLECHQSASRTNVDPRPNWEPYNAWLGFYGSLDDHTALFKRGFARNSFFNPETDQILLTEFDNEPQWFDNFWNNVRPNDARYSLLDQVINPNYSSETTINGDLTNRLGVLNMRRVARLIKENNELYEYIKWTVWSYARCGNQLDMTKDVRDWLAKVSPLPPVSSLETTTVTNPCIRIDGMNCVNNPNIPLVVEPHIRFTDLVHIAMEPFVDTEDWSMDFKTNGRYAAFERFGVSNDPRPPVSAAVQRIFGEDPEFANLSCEDIKKKSREKFGNLEQVKAFHESMNTVRQQVEAQRNGPLIQRCISCHVAEGGTSAPHIPFDQPQLLKERLQQGNYLRGNLYNEILFRTGPHADFGEQMPPRGLPSNEQRQQLVDYLNSL